MEVILCALLGFLLDCLLGDPNWMPHPVVGMGKMISAMETLLRRLFPSTARGEYVAGLVMAVLLLVGTFLFSAAVLILLSCIHPILRVIPETIWSWQTIAMRDLCRESENVYQTLSSGTLKEARDAVSHIVGRDTDKLSQEGVIRATVETVAENFSDGIIAPLLYLLIGGAPLALSYKAVNTMDSMVGYKNNRYRYFGRVPAKLDDMANWIPARLAAMLLMVSAGLSGRSGKNAFRIWRRDRKKHASPNSAQTESVMAGALEVQLAGPISYFGSLIDKPFIGDAKRPIELNDIRLANHMVILGSIFGLAIFCAVRALIFYLIGVL